MRVSLSVTDSCKLSPETMRLEIRSIEYANSILSRLFARLAEVYSKDSPLRVRWGKANHECRKRPACQLEQCEGSSFLLATPRRLLRAVESVPQKLLGVLLQLSLTRPNNGSQSCPETDSPARE